MRLLAAALIAGTMSAAFGAAPAIADPSDYGIQSVSASLSTSQAGDHPDFTTRLTLKTDAIGSPFAQTRDVAVKLPPGLLGNLAAFPHCTTLQLGLSPETSHCPQDSQIGVVEIKAFELGAFTEPLYSMTPGSSGVARLGLIAGIYPALINATVRSDEDYGVNAVTEGVPSAYPLQEATTTVWGVPAAESHDPLRLTAMEAFEGKTPLGGARESGLTPAPLMTNPTHCEEQMAVGFTVDSYQLPDVKSSMSAPLPMISGCGKLGFAPSLALSPTSHSAASSTGLDVTLKLPQNEALGGLATSHIRNALVTLPQGMTLAAGVADGLVACSVTEAGYKSTAPAQCPEASKLGTAEVDVPVLERPLQGAIYQRTPEPGNLFRIWLIVDDLGAHLALPGELKVDKSTGQISSLFIDMPQAPVREVKLHVFGGSRGPLATPDACGTYFTHYEFTPWSGNTPAAGDAPMKVDEGCDTGAFNPRLALGTTNPLAGAFSPLVLQLTRNSGEQNIAGIDVTMPPGLLAKPAGVPLCEGSAAQSGDCPAGSQIGTLTAAVGPGPAPLWIPQPGKAPTAIYLSGPYQGAPYSLVVKVPAQAGPFDLGTVITRAAIHIDPTTARATVSSDPLPQILEGAPISYRTLYADVDRPQFGLNPTSCEPLTASAKLVSTLGSTANPSAPFQATNCGRLRFKPRLSIRLFGKTNRGAHPSLRAVLRPRPGNANIATAQVTLPHSEFLDQAHIRTVCTRVQFASDACPQGSVYGHVTATSPLLDRPLSGPVYLRSSTHELPDLVVALHGQVDFNAVARIDSVNGGIRTTFEAVPDVPLTKVILTMQGGQKGLLVNSRNGCTNAARARVAFQAHNGKGAALRPALRSSCAKASQRH